MTNILQFFYNLTVVDWVIYSALSYVLEVISYYILAIWSLKYQRYIREWNQGNIKTNYNFIARNFFWPVWIPLNILFVLSVFVFFKRYELDKHLLKLEEEELKKEEN